MPLFHLMISERNEHNNQMRNPLDILYVYLLYIYMYYIRRIRIIVLGILFGIFNFSLKLSTDSVFRWFIGIHLFAIKTHPFQICQFLTNLSRITNTKCRFQIFDRANDDWTKKKKKQNRSRNTELLQTSNIIIMRIISAVFCVLFLPSHHYRLIFYIYTVGICSCHEFMIESHSHFQLVSFWLTN